MPDDIQFSQTAVQQILRDPSMREAMLDAVRPNVEVAKGAAPKRTGRGAASIHPEAILDAEEWIIDVGWTRERYYMYFHERGTRYMAARPFLVPAFRF